MSNNGRYSQIYIKIWNDEKFRQLSPEAQRLYFYVLTSPHSNMAGYYLIPKPYIKRDLGTLPKGLDKPFSELLDKGLIRYDEGSSVILIPNYFRYNSLDNKNQKIGANNRARELPFNSLVKDFKEICKKYYPKGLETLTKGLSEGSGNTEYRKQKQKQKTETEEDKSDSKSDDPSQKYNKFAPTTGRGLDYDKIKELWNSRVPKPIQIRKFTSKRKRLLRKRYKEDEFSLKEIIQAIQEQPFLLGESDKGWTADFTWIIESEDHYTNILERRYKDNKSSQDERILQDVMNDYQGGENHEQIGAN